jgi:hypothetical protein
MFWWGRHSCLQPPLGGPHVRTSGPDATLPAPRELLDTRAKIIDAGHAFSQPVRRVAGSFDPLLAEHLSRLREQAIPGELLVVEVTNPPHPLLSQRARAELVAALSFVDFVVLKNDPSAGDEDITGNFVQHVLRRHQEEEAG